MKFNQSHLVVLAKIKDVVMKNNSFIVLEHEKPDGDCIGSGLALVMALNQISKRALLVSQDPHPAMYDFLPGKKLYTRSTYIRPEDFQPDVAIFLDCTDPSRCGKSIELVGNGIRINIDHHVSNTRFGDVVLVDPEAAATGELVYELLVYLGVPITAEIATCLYVALLTDTGGFRYQNTTGHTHRVASKLIDAGVNAYRVAEEIYETKSLSSILLLGRALETLTLRYGGKLAYVYVTREMMRVTGASTEDTEGIINYPRSILGVEIALCFKEHETEGKVHVSFRSRSLVDVAEIAKQLGGGGHPRASGALIEGSVQDAVAEVLKVLDGLNLWTDS